MPILFMPFICDMNDTFLCSDCPRNCKIERSKDKPGGYCKSLSVPSITRAAPHYGEEPCISGTMGSGTVFFSGCNLGCVFCQNHKISRERKGRAVSIEQFRHILFELAERGVHNINLVTPSHFTRFISEALTGLSLGLPIVWNSSDYEKADSLKLLEGKVQIYMPDLKFMNPDLAVRYCAAPDYPERAKEAIREMYRQVGPYSLDGDSIMRSGLLIRHLIMPGAEENTRDVIDFVAEEFEPGTVLFSLMGQYTPMPGGGKFPELRCRVSPSEYGNMISYMKTRHIFYGYIQELCSATEEMIPEFDQSGVEGV